MRKLLLELISDLGKCPNKKTHESDSTCFLVLALPKVQIYCRKKFSHKVLYSYCYNFSFRKFWSIFKKKIKLAL